VIFAAPMNVPWLTARSFPHPPALGDTVKVAAKIGQATKRFDVALLASEVLVGAERCLSLPLKGSSPPTKEGNRGARRSFG